MHSFLNASVCIMRLARNIIFVKLMIYLMCIISTSTDSSYIKFVKAIHSVAFLTRFLISSSLKKGCQNPSDLQRICVVQVGQSVK